MVIPMVIPMVGEASWERRLSGVESATGDVAALALLVTVLSSAGQVRLMMWGPRYECSFFGRSLGAASLFVYFL